jgi:DNA repair exonuclease SbcCD ATPase subunit
MKIGDKKEFYKDFGTTYPQPILEFLKNFILDVDGLLLNFADQDDILFLLKAPNPIRLKLLSRLIGIGSLDKITEDLKSDYRKAVLDRTSFNSRIAEINTEIKKLPEIPVLEKDLAAKTAVLGKIKSKAEALGKLENLKQRILTFKEQAAAFKERSRFIGAIPKLTELAERYDTLFKIEKLKDALYNLNTKIFLNNNEISFLEQRILKGAEVLTMLLDKLSFCPACGGVLKAENREALKK